MPHGPAGTLDGISGLLRSLGDSLRGPAGPVAHQKRGLAGRDQAVGRVGPEGGTGRVEPECAEAAATEEAVLACHRSIACSTLGQVAPSSLDRGSVSTNATGISRPVTDLVTWLDHATCAASRQAPFRK